ncbi:hypothetical protein OK18_00345 [Chryseobacterium gallinarum]|uniref:Uncharacterized protein n=1 Tax=Chryseobacterium gallinarum TaxID=1324352 RepID=A0A0G3M2Q0_CHRGL|nr:hypothetical protein OK18_00345 [Chryseobacterium gallinarum]
MKLFGMPKIVTIHLKKQVKTVSNAFTTKMKAHNGTIMINGVSLPVRLTPPPRWRGPCYPLYLLSTKGCRFYHSRNNKFLHYDKAFTVFIPTKARAKAHLPAFPYPIRKRAFWLPDIAN